MDLTVRAFWGPRQESPPRLAERLRNTLQRLQEISGAALPDWHTTEDDAIAVDCDALARYIVAANPESDAAYHGYTTTLWARQPEGLSVQVSSTVGGAAQHTGSRVVVTMRSEAAPSSGGLAAAATSALVALAEEWEPDWGDVSDAATRKAVQASAGIRRSVPRCGYAVYLSSGRRELVPPDFPGKAMPTGDKGLVIVLPSDSGGFAEVEEIVELDARLRQAGALEKIPAPMNRARF